MCDCGKTTVVRSDYLKKGNTTSCGCAAQEKLEAGRKELKKTFVDGTNIKQIDYKRKLNSNNKTGIKGVSFIASRQKYRAHITFKLKVINLGEFDKLEDAVKASKKGEDMYFTPMLEDNNK